MGEHEKGKKFDYEKEKVNMCLDVKKYEICQEKLNICKKLFHKKDICIYILYA